MKEITVYLECERDDAYMIGCPLPEDEHRQVYLKPRTITEEGLKNLLLDHVDVSPEECDLMDVHKTWDAYIERVKKTAKALMFYINGGEEKQT